MIKDIEHEVKYEYTDTPINLSFSKRTEYETAMTITVAKTGEIRFSRALSSNLSEALCKEGDLKVLYLRLARREEVMSVTNEYDLVFKITADHDLGKFHEGMIRLHKNEDLYKVYSSEIANHIRQLSPDMLKKIPIMFSAEQTHKGRVVVLSSEKLRGDYNDV